jgi:hypothetical protein
MINILQILDIKRKILLSFGTLFNIGKNNDIPYFGIIRDNGAFAAYVEGCG